MAFYTGSLADMAMGPGAGTGMGEGVVRPAPMQPSGGSQGDPMAYYYQLGQQLLQQQIAMQQQMTAQMGQMEQQQGGVPAGNLNLGGSSFLTSGFDPGWLSTRLSAGSANGATLGGSGGGGGGMGGGKGGEDWEDQGPPDNTTAGDDRIKGGFWSGFKDLFGIGANNKFGFGR